MNTKQIVTKSDQLSEIIKTIKKEKVTLRSEGFPFLFFSDAEKIYYIFVRTKKQELKITKNRTSKREIQEGNSYLYLSKGYKPHERLFQVQIESLKNEYILNFDLELPIETLIEELSLYLSRFILKNQRLVYSLYTLFFYYQQDQGCKIKVLEPDGNCYNTNFFPGGENWSLIDEKVWKEKTTKEKIKEIIDLYRSYLIGEEQVVVLEIDPSKNQLIEKSTGSYI